MQYGEGLELFPPLPAQNGFANLLVVREQRQVVEREILALDMVTAFGREWRRCRRSRFPRVGNCFFNQISGACPWA